MKNLYKIEDELYIVDNIKDVNKDTKTCWCIDISCNKLVLYQGVFHSYHYKHYKKIIMTTDKSINVLCSCSKDCGAKESDIQAIDDEFLEWFVKNPNCEEVKIIYGLFNTMGRQVDPNNLGQNHSQCVWKYKIIIPKEEPKEEDCFCTDKCLGYLTKTCKKIENPKQETLKKYPVIIVRNDDNEEFIHLSNGIYRTKWGILNNGVSAHPLEAFDKTKFTFYYE